MRHNVFRKATARFAFMGAALLLTALAVGISTPQQIARAQSDMWQRTVDLDPSFAVEWMDAVYDAVRDETYNPPNSARVYAYAGVTLYESLLPGMRDNRSLVGQVNDLDDLPYPDESLMYDWQVVTAEAMVTVLGNLFRDKTESLAVFSDLRDTHVEARLPEMGQDVIDNSQTFGEELGKEIVNWIDADFYAETRGLNTGYVLPTGDDSMWALTAENTRPIEPFWGQIRPFMLGYADECNVDLNVEFSTEEGSTFYQQAEEIQNIGNDLTPDQRAAAEWWVDTPGLTGAPAGHWIKIMTQMVDHLDLNLERASEGYAFVGIGVADAFISCWSLKYQVNLLRPVTYIQNFINRRWESYIQTPPFPEYPSGHSVVSGAAADILTNLFGQVVFTDQTHTGRGLPPRTFHSFEAAGLEAATSRLYGGIHFRPAVENGVRQGRCVAQKLADNLFLNPIRQGE